VANHAGFFADAFSDVLYSDNAQNGQEWNYRQDVSYAYDRKKQAMKIKNLKTPGKTFLYGFELSAQKRKGSMIMRIGFKEPSKY